MLRTRYPDLFKGILSLAFVSMLSPLSLSAATPDTKEGDPIIPLVMTRLQLLGGAGADEMVVYIDSRATDGYDMMYDASKLPAGVPGVPNIFSQMGEDDFSINALGTFTNDKEVAITLNITKAGAYKITLLELLNLEPTTVVYFEDRLNNKFYNLRMETVMNFNFVIGRLEDRFYLHYYLPAQVSAVSESCRQNDGVVKFNNPSANPWDVSLLSADGLTELAKAEDVIGEHLFVGLEDADYNLSIVKKADGYAQMLPATVNAAVAIDAAFDAPAEPVMAGSTVSFFAHQTDSSIAYSWDMGDGTILTGNDTIQHIYTAPGVYNVSLLMSANDCSNASQASVVVIPDVVTALKTPETKNSALFELFPNPANEILSIRLNSKSAGKIEWLQIADVQGRIVHREYVAGYFEPQQLLSIPVKHLVSGTYFISLIGDADLATQPFVLRH